MGSEHITIDPLETNHNRGYQGEFRKAYLDLNNLKYAKERVSTYHINSHLVITCMDHMKNGFRYILDGKLHCVENEDSFVTAICSALEQDPSKVFLSYDPGVYFRKYEP